MEEQKPKRKKKNIFPIIMIIVVGGGLYFGITEYVYGLHHENTDDAQIEGNISPVAPRMSGYITALNVEDYQKVNKDQLVVTLDDRDLKIKVAQAQAAVDNAKANMMAIEASVASSQTGIATEKANVDAANVKIASAKSDFERYKSLLAEHSTTQQTFDNYKATLDAAISALDVAKAKLFAAQKQYDAAQQQVAVAKSTIAQRQADVDFAKLQLSYANITAPVSGQVSRKAVQNGQFVQAGQNMFSIVIDSSVWVVANFKETQLTKMRLGQKATIEVDAFRTTPIRGTVAEFSGATGAKFSLLPPDNATGNFVKVVQRVPVKIKLEGDKALLAKLRPGMSVKVTVDLDN